MPHDVPFISQYADLGDHEWRARGCGIASLAMVMAFWHSRNAAYRSGSLDGVLRAGLSCGAYREGIGWTHAGLVATARIFGYDGFNADYAAKSPHPKTAQEAWDLLQLELRTGPVLASVFSGLDPSRGGGHIVVVTGCADGLVTFNDPEALTAMEGQRVLALEAFLRAFKLRYIVIRPVDLFPGQSSSA
jgi:hypothetical protein